MKLTPQYTLWLAAIFVVLVMLTGVQLALQAPMLGLQLSSDEKNGLTITALTKGSPNLHQVSVGQRITKLDTIEIDDLLLIEEPDQIGNWAKYNGFLDTLSQLYSSAQQGALSAEVEGETITLITRPRQLNDLPLMLWFQLVVGALGFLIAVGVYAFRPGNLGALHFLIAGLGLLIFSSAAGVYSTRELIIDGQLVRVLSSMNHLGAISFTAALVSLLAVYPLRLNHHLPVMFFAYLSAFCIWVSFTFQLFPESSSDYLLTLLLFGFSFFLAFLQWRATKHSPVARASLKWYLLSIYLGSGLFAAFILLPVAIGIEPPASQGLMFAVFLFMFVGIAFGIVRYCLFDLDLWWLAAWSWFFGGLMVIVVDLLLLKGIGLAQGTSLALSLALVGWVYFPARQWVFSRLRRKSSDANQRIRHLVQTLFSAEETDQLMDLWPTFLTSEWNALNVQLHSGALSKPRISNDGQSLEVPHLRADHHLVLQHPQRGGRLFNRDDQDVIALLYMLATQAMSGLSERQHALEDKRRIFGDLHDDVGAKLLSLLHQAKDAESGELVRAALQDLRDVVSQPDNGVLPLLDALADWRSEAQSRLDNAGIELKWHQADIENPDLSVYILRHLSRILREALNNVIKHSQATEVCVQIVETTEGIQISVVDNGQSTDPEMWTIGRGVRNIHYRLEKLRGSGQWLVNDQGGCTLQIRVPVENASA